MNKITQEEFDLTHSAKDLTKEKFDLLSDRALDLTEELCFGRASRNEEAARRAMKEMIAFWIARNGGKEGVPLTEREAVGNYSVTHKNDEAVTVHGVPVSPSALLILNRAGLRDRAV